MAPATPANQLETAIALADKAFYQAKANGRNQVVYWERGELLEEGKKYEV